MQRKSLENDASTKYLYLTVGIGTYGSISVTTWGPKPGEKDLEELAKWVRDTSGECSAPLYILYAGPNPPYADYAEKPLGELDDMQQSKPSLDRVTVNLTSSQALLAATASLFILLATVSLYRAKRFKTRFTSRANDVRRE